MKCAVNAMEGERKNGSEKETNWGMDRERKLWKEAVCVCSTMVVIVLISASIFQQSVYLFLFLPFICRILFLDSLYEFVLKRVVCFRYLAIV